MLANGLLVPALSLQMFWPWMIWIGAFWGITFPAAMILLARMAWQRFDLTRVSA